MENTNIIQNQVTTIENNSDKSSDERPVKNPVGRPRVEWRHMANGKYDKNPISKTYYKDYYNEKLSYKVECEFCKKMIGQQKLKVHQARDTCKKFQNSS